jgi:predicted nucleic acid-binding protein
MRHVVVDASVIIAALMADGRVRKALLNTPDVAFYAPPQIVAEIRSAIPEITKRARKPPSEVQALIDDVLARLILVPMELLAASADHAASLAKAADALDDAPYVACALVVKAPVWTLDKDFERMKEITTLKTNDFFSPLT